MKDATVFVTRYWLTKGIVECEGKMDKVSFYGKLPWTPVTALLRSKDFALTMEDAIAQCEEKRQKKLLSLRNQIADLEAMTTHDFISGRGWGK